MARDHALLRRLTERFEHAEQAHERIPLLQLALDFHEMHTLFEARWMPLPELAPARAILEDLAEQIECTVPASALHRARGLIWIEHLIGLMGKEETCHREQLPRSGPITPWSPEFLGWRTALISATRAVP